MSHSKQTANYGLPLFEPKDRPAWLTDFNGAMTAVDATVKGLEDSIQAGGLPVTGGTMQGSINMGDHAITNVQEVELQSSGDGLYIGSVVQPSGTSGARLTGVAGGAAAFVKPDSQSIYVPVSVGSPSQDKHAATKEYVDAAIGNIPSSGITQEQADARYLQLSGGTMAGDLKVQESPASAASAVSKSYAQGLFASALPKSGGTMTGDLILNGAPTTDNQAATKAYVDANTGGVTKTLIWDNPSPAAEFAYQTVTPTVIVDNPLLYLVVFNTAVPYGGKFVWSVLPEMANSGLRATYFNVRDGDVWCAGRGVQLTTDGAFAFEHAYYHETVSKAGVQNNKYIVPIQIYALK